MRAPDPELEPCTAAIVAAARRRGIPCLRHGEGASFVQLGWGRAGRRIHATFTSRTSHIAVQIARDKPLARSLLREAGVPIPDGGLVATALDAVQALERLGAPVIVKPLDGRAMSDAGTELRTPDAVRAAFERARRHGERVIVERRIEGESYRVLVVNGRSVAAAHRSPPCVIADGLRTVRELIDAENRRRGSRDSRANRLAPIPCDGATDEVLARQGLTPDSVAPAAMIVKLRSRAELRAGATVEDVTALVHPEVAAACERAALAIGLDVAGVDLVCRDISLPLAAQGGGIIDVDATLETGVEELAASGDCSRVGEAIVQALFPEGEDGRIPVFALTGARATPTALLLAQALQACGMRAGVATARGIRIGADLLNGGDCKGYLHARAVLGAPDVEAAVLEMGAGSAERHGLAFDRCDAAIVTRAGGQAARGDDAPRATRLVLRAARAIALDVDDPGCAALARLAAADARVVPFSGDGESAAVAAHLARGGSAVYLRGSLVVAALGERRIPLMDVHFLDLAAPGPGEGGTADVLAVCAGLLAHGLEPQAIAAALGADRAAPVCAVDRISPAARRTHAH